MYKEVLSKVTTHQEMTGEEISALIAAINAGDVSAVQIARDVMLLAFQIAQ